MMFLLPFNCPIDFRFGILMNDRLGLPEGLSVGMRWAIDNQCYSGTHKLDKMLKMLERLKPYQNSCLFTVVPDVLANSKKTMKRWEEQNHLFDGWPKAFVAQDGQEDLPFPSEFDVLFIGGTTHWKNGPGAIECILRAQKENKRIHIGRVNTYRRYTYFSSLKKSKEFTCDGTLHIYTGQTKAIKKLLEIMGEPNNPYLPLFECNNFS